MRDECRTAADLATAHAHAATKPRTARLPASTSRTRGGTCRLEQPRCRLDAASHRKQGVPMSTSAHVLGVLQQTGGFLTDVVPNPPAKAPAGVADPVAAVISYVKWGVLIVIFLSALAGVGALAGGRVFGNHGASKVGVSMLVTAVGALVVYVGLYAFLSGFGAA